MRNFFFYRGADYCGSGRGKTAKEAADEFAKNQRWPVGSVRASRNPPGLDKKYLAANSKKD